MGLLRWFFRPFEASHGYLFLHLTLLFTATAVCQESSPTSPLLWYESTRFSIHGGTAMSRTCLIILADNSVYLEHETRNFRDEKAAQAFHGTITAEERQQLMSLLDSPELRNLPSVAAKRMPQIAKDLDATGFIIPRNSGPQKLSDWESENASSRSKVLDPLIQWARRVQRKKFTLSPNAVINRCALQSLLK
jgi:hypothetical protein